MKRFLILLFVSSNIYASECLTLPYGDIKSDNQNIVKLCRNSYTAYFDDKEKYTVNVSYILTPNHSISCGRRKNNFRKDPDVIDSPTQEDYDKSGFDRGHLTPYLDNAWGQLVQDESFFMTNIAPQIPALNRGIWKSLENDVRVWSNDRQHELMVYVGSIYKVTDKKIGSSKVDVPQSFYKVIVDIQTKESLAFMFPNIQKLSTDLTQYQVTVKDIENETKLEIPVPGYKEDKQKIWRIDYTKYFKAKISKCKK